MKASRNRTPALYRHYLILGVLSALTIAMALYVCQGFVRVSSDTLAMHRVVGRQAARHDAMAMLASAVIAPASDVFISNDPIAEAERFEARYRAFHNTILHTISDVRASIPAREAAPIVATLQDIDRGMWEVVAASDSFFGHLRARRTSDAIKQRVHMDRLYERTRVQILQLRIQTRVLDEMASDIEQKSWERLRRTQYAVFALLAVTGIFVFLHAHRLARATNVTQERERVFDELQRLNSIFENALGGVAIVDHNGIYTFVNAAYARCLDRDPHEIVGSKAGYWVFEDDRPLVAWALDELTRTGRAECELRVTRRDDRLGVTRVVLVASGGDRFLFSKDITAEKQAEEARRRSEERFELATRATNDVIWEWDLVRHRLWISDALPQRIGVPLSGGDVDGDLWIDAIHPDDRERAVCNATVAMDSGVEHWNEEYRVRRADGTYANVFDRAFIVRDADGTAQRMIGAMVDISARKVAEDSIANLVRQNEMILSSMAEGAFGIDVEGRATFVNESAAKLLGWRADELIGRRIHDVVHHSREDGSPYPWHECPSQEVLLNGTSVNNGNQVFWRNDGSAFPVDFACRPMRNADGNVVGAVITFRDITERRAVEKMKDEFVSIVSHELRTPLTSIRGALGLLAGGRVGDMPERARRMLDIAVSNTDRLVRLINDILDIERMESGRITLTRQFCDAGDLIDEAVEVMRPMATRAGVELEALPCNVTIYADRDRVVQTITNLISNAIKFSDPSTRVTVAASTVDGQVQFEVADQGRGIPESKLDAIFERFQQVDASDSREKGGSGLGLAICRSIVRQHGGEIWCESELGRGSRFRFTMQRANVTQLSHVTRGKTVAVCDSDADRREMLTSLLERNGYQPLVFTSGAELLASSSIAADAVLLDVAMPGDAFETLAALRHRGDTAELPIVVLSMVAPDKELGATDWVQLPCDDHTLLRAVHRALGVQGRKARVLLVEDDLDLARVIGESFQRHGIETLHATTGDQAIELAQRVTPDLLVLDLILPGVDGYGVVDWLKEHNLLRRVPLVIYSATETTPAQRERLTLGPTQFFTKSRVSPEEFERRVVQLLAAVSSPRGAMPHVA
ncbi:MAG TPA: PAS domain S-box protein [Thermoanaerobaculia bacterium]|jgi:hypothetical protein